MDKRLLDILCCPATRLPLEILDAARLGQLNSAISAGTIRNQASLCPAPPLEEALVTRDGRWAYPIRDGIPALLEDECIDLSQLAA
ncbi:MAG: Trm112 family protein [Gammaproteobacteria bacterium]|nr:Trm112 family protein [Gammaproteobacteria bacterium]